MKPEKLLVFKIIGSKKFSDLEITGFTFDYPVYEGANIKISKGFENKNKCDIKLYKMETRTSHIMPFIRLEKDIQLGGKFLSGKEITERIIEEGRAPSQNAKRNPNNALYDIVVYQKSTLPEDRSRRYILFFGKEFGVKIEIFSYYDVLIARKKMNAEDEEMWKSISKMVIESFRFK